MRDTQVSVKRAAEISGYNPEYIRRLARSEKISAGKVSDNHVEKWMVDVESLMQYKIEHQGAWGGRRLYRLYIHPLYEERIREMLFEEGIEFDLEVANAG